MKSVITGRRASQGAARMNLKPLHVDSTGLLKLNPFLTWSYSQVHQYIMENNVPRNKLLDQGYKSVGDWHSTVKVREGQDERAGRWAGREKTECGLHQDYMQRQIAASKVLSIIISQLLVKLKLLDRHPRKQYIISPYLPFGTSYKGIEFVCTGH